MKKRISILLCVLMLLSSLTLFANAETSVSYEAPVLYGTQSTTPVENKFSVRFLSVVTSLNGAKVGYSIEASYGEGAAAKTLCFTDEGMETSVIFASILADSKTVTVNELASELKLTRYAGILALELTDIPADEDITFSVKTYVKDPDGKICAESEAVTVRYTDGQRNDNLKEVTIYSQDFNSISINSAASTSEDSSKVKEDIELATGWTANRCSSTKTEYPIGMVSKDGALEISGGTGVNNFVILPKGTLTNYLSYSVEMDLNVKATNAKMVFFALHEKSDSSDRSNEIRLRDYTNEQRNTLGGTNGYLGMQYSFAKNGTVTTNVQSNFGLTGSGFNQDFHMRVEVDNSANTITVFMTPAGGTEIKIFTGTLTVETDGSFAIGFEQVIFTIDNLVIKGISKAE